MSLQLSVTSSATGTLILKTRIYINVSKYLCCLKLYRILDVDPNSRSIAWPDRKRYCVTNYDYVIDKTQWQFVIHNESFPITLI